MSLMFDESWLARLTEDPVDPGLPIVDPHHHLWQGWRGANDYTISDLAIDTTAGHRVIGTVYVECRSGYRTDGPAALRPVGETEFVVRHAREHPDADVQIAGIVGLADVTLGDEVDHVLEAHVVAGEGRFRGIRYSTTYDPHGQLGQVYTRPPAGLMADDRFRRGVARLAAHGLTFDAWLYHHQIPELTELARAVPDVTFVLDHLGGLVAIGPYAGQRDAILEQWRRDMAELASCANVRVKLGGVGMAMYGLGYESRLDPPSSDDLVADWGGAVVHAIELFGADRCMFESNFPVDKVSMSYVTLWNAFKKMVAGASADERTALFSGTAGEVYRL
jgi:predicted TIM-barrel fold metal-dependent hydrolase